jgi:hypothetical protein
MRIPVPVAIAIIVLSGCSDAGESLKHEVEVVKGPLSLQFWSDKAVYDFGEPIHFEIRVCNDSQEAVAVWWPHASLYPFEMEIQTAQGSRVISLRDPLGHLPVMLESWILPGEVVGAHWDVPDTLDAGRYIGTGWPQFDRDFEARIGFRVRPPR